MQDQQRDTSPDPGSSRVGVLRANGHYRLIATSDIPPGQHLFYMQGDLVPNPSRFSVQLGELTHLDLVDEHTLEELLDRYFWRFMNHSCSPNTRICDRNVITCKPIAAGHDITFNYNTTEYDMAEPFACHCGNAECRGVVRGFKHLSPAERDRLGSTASAHLWRLARGIQEDLPVG